MEFLVNSKESLCLKGLMWQGQGSIAVAECSEPETCRCLEEKAARSSLVTRGVGRAAKNRVWGPRCHDGTVDQGKSFHVGC